MDKIELVTHDAVSAFHSLGLPNADDLQLRSERLMAIGELIAERGLKQREVAALLGMKRSELSDLIRGKISKFSAERLACILHDLSSGVGRGGVS